MSQVPDPGQLVRVRSRPFVVQEIRASTLAAEDVAAVADEVVDHRDHETAPIS